MEQAVAIAKTVDDYMAMPEGPPDHQLIEGELFMSPSPSWRHQDIIGNLFRILSVYLQGTNLGKALLAPLDVVLDQRNVFQPDILFISNERKKILGKRFVEGAPDFVVEILSESTADLDTDRKPQVYARSGVRELWIIDPEVKEIAVYDLGKSTKKPVAIDRRDARFTSAIFPSLTFSCAEIFA